MGNRRQEKEITSSQWKLDVVSEIRKWSQQVLERPSKHFNGLPPCPFAKRAWIDKKVKIDFGGKKTIIDKCINWDDSLDLVIIVTEDWEWGEIDEWCENENDNLQKDDLTLMAFVPCDDSIPPGQPEEELEDWDHILDEPYAMVFIQRLTTVNAASEKLEQKGYYKNCTAEFLEYVKDRQSRTNNAR